MPNIKSSKKRVKVTAAKTMKNKMTRSELRTNLKKFAANIADAEDKAAAVALAYKQVDQAAAAGIIHPNNAAHRKSAIAKAAK
jgi:small subunit ribosomal protein S20